MSFAAAEGAPRRRSSPTKPPDFEIDDDDDDDASSRLLLELPEIKRSPRPEKERRRSSIVELGNGDGGERVISALFFACGVGASLCYISILSSLVYFKSKYGGELPFAAVLASHPLVQ